MSLRSSGMALGRLPGLTSLPRRCHPMSLRRKSQPISVGAGSVLRQKFWTNTRLQRLPKPATRHPLPCCSPKEGRSPGESSPPSPPAPKSVWIPWHTACSSCVVCVCRFHSTQPPAGAEHTSTLLAITGPPAPALDFCAPGACLWSEQLPGFAARPEPLLQPMFCSATSMSSHSATMTDA